MYAENITINNNVYNLSTDDSIRDALERMTDPLQSKGMDRIEFEGNNKTPESISSDEASYFQKNIKLSNSLEEGPNEGSLQGIFKIIRPTLEGNLVWTLSHGRKNYPVRVEDKKFLDLVESGRPFKKGDSLRGKIKIIETLKNNNKTSTQYILERVDEVIFHQYNPTSLTLKFHKTFLYDSKSIRLKKPHLCPRPNLFSLRPGTATP
jgi:hypothetical protein